MHQIATFGHAAAGPAPARVLLVDAHEACREAMSTIIARSKYPLSVVAEAQTIEIGSKIVAEVPPHAIVVGLENDDDPGVIAELCMRAPEAGVLVVSSRADGAAVLACLRAGAIGFMPTWAEPEEIVESLMTVAGGSMAIHPSVSSVGAILALHEGAAKTEASRRLSRLTKRERETLSLLSLGLRAQQIGARMFVSRRTVERHLANAYRKLNVHSAVEAVRSFELLHRMTG